MIGIRPNKYSMNDVIAAVKPLARKKAKELVGGKSGLSNKLVSKIEQDVLRILVQQTVKDIKKGQSNG